nr:hypothetical protein [Tanacetum cinerariifolium]
MLVPHGDGSGTPTESHHTPSSEAQQPSPTTHSSSLLPPITTTTIPPVISTESLPTIIPSDNPPLRQYTRRTRIAQSLVLPPVADEPASPLGVISQGEACLTDYGFEVDQDKANIAKTSTLLSDSTPRVTSLAADEGSMQQKLDELMALCTSLQRQQSEMASRFEAQELEINSLKAKIKPLEDKDKGVADQSRDDAQIKGRSLDEGEEEAKRVKVTTATVSIPTGSGVVSTASLSIPTAAPIFTTTTESTPHSRRKAQELEINSLKTRIKPLEDKDKGVADQSRDDAQIKGRSLDEGEEEAKRVSDDTEEMATILTSMDATKSTPHSRRKGKETMVESETPKKKKVQEQIDAQLTRELEEQMAREDQRMSEQIARDAEVARIHTEEELQMMINSLDRGNEIVVKYFQEDEQIPKDLSIGERIELISDLVKYQENYAQVLKYQTLQRKPRSKKQKKDYYMVVIKGHAGWKTKDFKGMSFEQIKEKFNTAWKQIKDFIPIGLKEEAERLKRKGLKLQQESTKKLKTSEEVPEEVKSSEEVPEEKVKR